MKMHIFAIGMGFLVGVSNAASSWYCFDMRIGGDKTGSNGLKNQDTACNICIWQEGTGASRRCKKGITQNSGNWFGTGYGDGNCIKDVRGWDAGLDTFMETDCHDGLWMDRFLVRESVNHKNHPDALHVWGASNSHGWCLSKDYDDHHGFGDGTASKCWKTLRFNYDGSAHGWIHYGWHERNLPVNEGHNIGTMTGSVMHARVSCHRNSMCVGFARHDNGQTFFKQKGTGFDISKPFRSNTPGWRWHYMTYRAPNEYSGNQLYYNVYPTCACDGDVIKNDRDGDWCWLKQYDTWCEWFDGSNIVAGWEWTRCEWNGDMRVDCAPTPRCECDYWGTYLNHQDGHWCYLEQTPCMMDDGYLAGADWTWARCEWEGKTQVHCPGIVGSITDVGYGRRLEDSSEEEELGGGNAGSGGGGGADARQLEGGYWEDLSEDVLPGTTDGRPGGPTLSHDDVLEADMHLLEEDMQAIREGTQGMDLMNGVNGAAAAPAATP